MRLSDREFDIMQILWLSEKPLLASEILKRHEGLNINTVQSVLRKLMAKDYIEVADIIHSGNVLGRTYRPLITADQYMIMEFKNILPSGAQRQNTFFAAFLDATENKEETLQELEKLISDYRERPVN